MKNVRKIMGIFVLFVFLGTIYVPYSVSSEKFSLLFEKRMKAKMEEEEKFRQKEERFRQEEERFNRKKERFRQEEERFRKDEERFIIEEEEKNRMEEERIRREEGRFEHEDNMKADNQEEDQRRMEEEAKKNEAQMRELLKQKGDLALILIALSEKKMLHQEKREYEKLIDTAKKIIRMDISEQHSLDATWNIIDAYHEMGKTQLLLEELMDIFQMTTSNRVKAETINMIVHYNRDRGQEQTAIDALDQLINNLEAQNKSL